STARYEPEEIGERLQPLDIFRGMAGMLDLQPVEPPPRPGPPSFPPRTPAATRGSSLSRLPPSPGCAQIASAPASCATEIASSIERRSLATNALPAVPRYLVNASGKS